MIDFLEHSMYFGVTLSMVAYGIGLSIRKRWNHPLCNPLLISILLIIGFLLLTGISNESYQEGAHYLRYLLTPATVSLAIPLYHQIDALKKNWFPILSGIAAGVVTNLSMILILSNLFDLSHVMYVTLLPKSITSAIGLDLASSQGGVIAITATAIIITGIIGNICGESICKRFKITHPVAIGVAIGTSSHAVGTSKAMELGEVEGAMSSLSIVVTGLCTIVGMSIFVPLY